MATHLANYDIVIFHGPKYTGQSLFFTEKLSETHVAVCPSEIFSKNPSLGLRDIMIHATKLLWEGKMIAFVDENASRAVRESYIKYMNRKHPNKKICILELLPACGIDHLFWSREFSVADMAAKIECDDQDINMVPASLDDSQILKWFHDIDDGPNTLCHSEKVDPPNKDEGVEIKREKIPLMTNSVFKFEVPVLYIQWESIQGDHSERRLEQNICKALRLWSQSNPCGRIIFIHDGSQIKTGKTTLSQTRCEVREIMQNFVCQFTECPLYLLHLENADEAGEYATPPKPGLLAFLQRRHHLNLQSKSSIYLYQSTSHYQMAEGAGLQSIKVSRVVQNPSLVLSHNASAKATMPALLKDFQVKLDSRWSDADPIIPLYRTRDKYQNSFTSCYLGCGRREYIFARDWDIVERYQKQYAEKARRVNDLESIIDARETCLLLTPSRGNDLQNTASISSTIAHNEGEISRDIPMWMLGRSPGSTLKSKSYGTASFDVKIRQTEYVMTEMELTLMAEEILKQASREDLIEKAKSGQKQNKKTNSERNAKVCESQECNQTAVKGPQHADDNRNKDFDKDDADDFAQGKDILDDLFHASWEKKKSPKKKARFDFEDVDKVPENPNNSRNVWKKPHDSFLKKTFQHGNGDVDRSSQKTRASGYSSQEDSYAKTGNNDKLGLSEEESVLRSDYVKHDLANTFIESSRKRPITDLSILDEIFS
ncbi:hypothetical protein CHS0354_041296 [Potamilus streckersoni]|uniref:Uncharacterized protein n=1 Tax=Potamilus streckersoni TaxID=2493646 RepID=A0AAE0SF94_9BIVA|nr:hypothetical protein CHS0354_041296 [Potamilus streckersoni]